MSTLAFSLHREVTGNEYLEVYDLLKLPATRIRAGYFEVPLADLNGEPYVRWANAIVEDDDDALWDIQRIEEELERLSVTAGMLTDSEAAELQTKLSELLPTIQTGRCWLRLRFPSSSEI